MQKPFVVTEQKLAERLVILRERGTGMLTRIYNIKKGKFSFGHIFYLFACSDASFVIELVNGLE